MALQWWPYWLQFGISAGLLVVMFFMTTGTRDYSRWVKFWAATFILLALMLGGGISAFHDGFNLRSDGQHVLITRWWVVFVQAAAFALFISFSLSRSVAIAAFATAFGALSGACTLISAYTPSRHNFSQRKALDVLTALEFGALGMMLLIWLCEVFGLFDRFISVEEGQTGRAAHKESDRPVLGGLGLFGSSGSTVFSKLTLALVAVWAAVVLAVFPLLLVLGPEGYRIYHDQFEQTWLTMALGEGVLGVTMLVVHILINPDGAIVLMPFAVFDTSAKRDPITSLMMSRIDTDPHMPKARAAIGAKASLTAAAAGSGNEDSYHI